MSLYGALFSGVSGLAAQSSAMGAISDNITNVNTTGYKGAKVNFSTLITKQVSTTNYSPGGVQSRPRASVDVQGLLQATNSSTDVALSGQGFFVVNESANPGDGDMFAYTRAGSFKVDNEGYLQNVSGWYMQGWPLTGWDGNEQASTVDVGNSVYMKSYKNDDGDTVYVNDNIVSERHLQPLNLNEMGGTASPTSNLRMGANLPNSKDIGYSVNQPVTIYDSLGGDSTLQFQWEKTAQNNWGLEAYPPEGARAVSLKNGDGDIYQTMGRLDFQSMPEAGGVITMTINGTAYTFRADTGTDGTTVANAFYTDPDTASSIGDFVGDFAADIDAAFRLEYESVFDTPTYATDDTVFESGSSIAINGDSYDVSGMTPSQAAAYINIDYPTIDFGPDDNNPGGFSVTNNDGATTFSFTGDGSCSSLSGLSLGPGVGDAVGPRVTTMAAGAAFAADAVTRSTLTIGTTTIDVSGMSLTEAVDAINSETSGTNVSAFEFGGQLALYSTEDGDIELTATGGLSMFDNQTITGTGRNYCEQLAGTNSLIVRQFDSTAGNDIAISGLDTMVNTGVSATIQGMDPVASTSDAFTLEAIQITDSAIEFYGDGTPMTIMGKDDNNGVTIEVDWANGSKDMAGGASDDTVSAITLFLGNYKVRDGMTQSNGDYQLNYWSQNGAKFGNFAGVSIGSDGIVTATFDNGVTRPVFQIPVATFVNPNGMEGVSGNVFISTDNSGEPTLRTAGGAGAGQVSSASLEASTVDIGTEFTTMIITQRAYSASAKIITTADEMLDELVRIKR